MWSVNDSYCCLKLYLNLPEPCRCVWQASISLQCTAVCSQTSVSVWHMDISKGWRIMECDIYRETCSCAKLGFIRGEPEVWQLAVNIRFQSVISVQWRSTTDLCQDFCKTFFWLVWVFFKKKFNFLFSCVLLPVLIVRRCFILHLSCIEVLLTKINHDAIAQ